MNVELAPQSLIHFGGIGSDPDNRLDPMSNWIRAHSDLFAGKKVLDLGSNAGHFPLLYHSLGAHVTAVEPRKVFREWFEEQFPNTNIAWRTEDVRDYHPTERFDVVSCLGLIYHVKGGYHHLQRIIRESRAKQLLLDTMIWPTEHVAIETSRLNTNCFGAIELVPHPSICGMESFFEACGWRHELVLRDWCDSDRAMWLVTI